ncbi:unnamed protein product [Mytilus edulis]|uniref:Endonuclease-reverse transcriptase n=1 Tax=Mytilus edulis TaxID=6550 RepID=A0A8S3RT92_MYTED|nr:unnamed protein product [Mytilus edulis]
MTHFPISLKLKQTPRNVPIYNKANWETMKKEVINLQHTIQEKVNTHTVDELWLEFKTKLNELVSEHIPHKKLTTKNKTPWVTFETRKLMKKRDRLYKKMKKSGNDNMRNKYKQIKHQYGQEINSKLVEIVTENDFIQMVKEPTRGKNILDLILTNNPGLIERTQTQPGMSDHEIVITDINIKAKTYRKKPRNVYIYKKADMNSLQNDIDQAFTDHLKDKDNLTNSVEDNWNFSKTQLSTV